MHRREALAFLGTAVLAPLLSPLSAQERYALGTGLHRRIVAGKTPLLALTPAQMATLVALSDTILPATDTPGAVEVGVPAFIDVLVAEWYGDDEKAELLRGLDGIEERSGSAGGRGFADGDAANRAAFLATIDGKPGEKGSVEAGYQRLKEAIVYGYITSEPIALRMATTPIIPGRFDGCIPAGGPR